MLDRFYNTPARKGFRWPGRLLAGAGARHELKALLAGKPVLAVLDQAFAKADALDGLDVAQRAIVTAEPSEADVLQARAALGGKQVAAVVAIGGGSTLDVAKALHAHLCFGRVAIRDVERPAGAPVLIALPTTAGSGSETSRFFILKGETGLKLSHRAWSCVPDVTICDPQLLRGAPQERLVLAAFDAYVHLWETFVCLNERSPVTDMLAKDGIAAIAAALKTLAFHLEPDDATLGALQRASAYGGLAISNVRTGAIHTLAESLAASVPLGHPETLIVFYDSVFVSYRPVLEPRIAELDAALAALPGGLNLDAVNRLWRKAFAELGIEARIRRTLKERRPDIAAVTAAALRDHVLFKEHPAPLTPDGLERIARAALVRFGADPALARIA